MNIHGFDLRAASILSAEIKNESDFNNFINTLKNKNDLIVGNEEGTQSDKVRIVWEKIQGA